jgi:hypothetical protein
MARENIRKTANTRGSEEMLAMNTERWRGGATNQLK